MFDQHGAVAEPMADAPPTACSPECAPTRARRLSGLGAGWLVTALLALNLVSCGGGGDGGVGTNGTGITAGTVNGFGSVIVDGLRFDDSGATVRTDDGSTAGDSYVPADVKFGQRLRVSYSGVADDTTASKGVAQTLEVDPSIVGTVTEKGGSTFKVLGQSINVIDDTSPLALPRTVFSDGYAIGNMVATGIGVVGDTVEVHAVRSGTGTDAIFVATRVEKLTGSPVLRLGGVVSRLVEGTTKTFFLGSQKVSYGGATLFPSGASLAGSNVDVVVFGAPSSSDSSVLAATKIRVRQATVSAASVDDASVSGIVTNLATGSRMDVGNTPVSLTSLDVANVSGTLANDAYVRVRGRFDTAGSFVASKVQIRDGRSDDASELHGTVVGYSAATTALSGSFTVRGTLVTIPNTGVFSNYVGCGTAAANLTEGSFVEVKGVSSATGVTATKISCESEGSGSVVSRTGALVGGTFTGGSDRTFDLQVTLQNETRTYNVTFNDATVFVSSGRAQTLAQGLDLLASRTTFEVEGSLSGTTGLVAKKIKPE